MSAYATVTDAARTICYVVGARPNFMKMAPVLTATQAARPHDRHLLVHTGQHYDEEMSRIFFEQLGFPLPDRQLDVGSATHGAQTARVLETMEAVLLDERPDALVVAGDVNSTLGAALAAVKLGIPIAHIEAGLRSFDRTMPEEINRVLTDQISDILFTHSPEARDNLIGEGVEPGRVHFVGNTMIDTLVRLREHTDARPVLDSLSMNGRPYILVTLHRPALVDGPLLNDTLMALDSLTHRFEVLFPTHPRTRAAIDALGVEAPNVRMIPPMGYLEFLSLQASAAAVLTDSGGIQEETTVLGVPCFTLRDNTERPITVSQGTNMLLGLHPERIRDIPRYLEDAASPQRPPAGWDGEAGSRAASVLSAFLD